MLSLALFFSSPFSMATPPAATLSTSTPTAAPNASSVEETSAGLVIMHGTHAVYKHFLVKPGDDSDHATKVCMYCRHKFTGGMYRAAQHITSWKGMRRREIRLCEEAPKTARDGVKSQYETKSRTRDQKRAAEVSAVAAVSGASREAKKSRMTDFYGDASACKKNDADESICLAFAALRLPEHHADHPVWHNMVSCIARAGEGYLAPRRRYVGGVGLQKCRKRIEAALAPIAASWRRDGVTVSSDMMTDRNGRPQANVLLINDSGAVFAETIDSRMESKTGGYIAGLLRPILKKVGPENVVAFCMDGGSNYAAACRELMEDYPHIEYIPCATHVLDLLMEDVGKMDWAKNLVTRGGEIITFTRNHHFTRGYLRSSEVKGGKGKQVLKPAGTRFGTQFIAISRLVEVRAALVQMVLSDEWKEWATGARSKSADTFREHIMDEAWWKKAEFFTKLMAKPFAVMRATDAATKGMMGRLYDAMLQLTEDVDAILEEHSAGHLTRAEVKEIRLIVKDRWDKCLACPLHVVGRILNPVNQEEGIFRNDIECTRVLKGYIAKHYDHLTITASDGEERRASLVLQEELTAYLTLQGSFGLPTALEDRAAVKAGKMTAVQWWNWHGTDAPHLATCAIRNLSQPVSASPCERNWSMWDAVHTARRNRLGSEKCRDLVYVVHNWQVVHNWYKVPEGQRVVKGNIPEAPLPEGYKVEEDGAEEEVGEEEDMVLEDEYA
ncbi:unnamed protein product [Closterium sp. NIES-65]|nr:unnamed protein product [Closterium sp. NIES-65]